MQFSLLGAALLLILGTISSNLLLSGEYVAGGSLTAVGVLGILYFGRRQDKFELLLQDKPSS